MTGLPGITQVGAKARPVLEVPVRSDGPWACSGAVLLSHRTLETAELPLCTSRTTRPSRPWLTNDGFWVSVVPRDDRPEGFLLNGGRWGSRMVKVAFTIVMLAGRSER